MPDNHPHRDSDAVLEALLAETTSEPYDPEPDREAQRLRQKTALDTALRKLARRERRLIRFAKPVMDTAANGAPRRFRGGQWSIYDRLLMRVLCRAKRAGLTHEEVEALFACPRHRLGGLIRAWNGWEQLAYLWEKAYMADQPAPAEAIAAIHRVLGTVACREWTLRWAVGGWHGRTRQLLRELLSAGIVSRDEDRYFWWNQSVDVQTAIEVVEGNGFERRTLRRKPILSREDYAANVKTTDTQSGVQGLLGVGVSVGGSVGGNDVPGVPKAAPRSCPREVTTADGTVLVREGRSWRRKRPGEGAVCLIHWGRWERAEAVRRREIASLVEELLKC